MIDETLLLHFMCWADFSAEKKYVPKYLHNITSFQLGFESEDQCHFICVELELQYGKNKGRLDEVDFILLSESL